MTRKLLIAAALGMALGGVPTTWAHGGHAAAGPASLEMLTRTVVPIENAAPLDAATLVGTDGKPASAQLLRGHWTLLYFGYTSCQDVCPTTLHTLARVAHDPASGVASGRTGIAFVTIDPAHDTPARMRAYLASFDARIAGLGGDPGAVRRFGAAAGAGSAASESGIDHSTSIYVLDAAARPVAVLLRPSDQKRIIADLAALRASHDPALAQGR